MRFDDDFDNSRNGMPIIYMALGVSGFILAVLVLVIALNNKNSSNHSVFADGFSPTLMVSSQVEPVITPSSTLVASDLDIWDMYPAGSSQKPEKKEVTPTPEPTEEVVESPTVTPDLDDGKHVKITYKDGSEEWLVIDNKIEKNNYDFSNLVNSGGLLKYYSDGKNIAFVGIDVSRYQKDIDFVRIKAQGIDFVMIRLGARGYKNGTISIDEYFETNINSAIAAGLDVGVYFYSQAVNEEEALEEANFVISSIEGKDIKYPVAFDMEFVDNDSARIDTLTKSEKTAVTAAFVNRIKEAGYRPMIYGNKEWLLKRIDISKFTSSCFWLAQNDEQPDYPYMFDMWQYSTDGELYGIDGKVDLDICFVDYAAQ